MSTLDQEKTDRLCAYFQAAAAHLAGDLEISSSTYIRGSDGSRAVCISCSNCLGAPRSGEGKMIWQIYGKKAN